MTDRRLLRGVPIAVTDREFALFQRLVYDSSGIFLSPAKRALLAARLSGRIRQLGLPSFAAYYRRVQDGGEAEKQILLDSISTNETHFFREPAQFEFLRTEIVPAWLRERGRNASVRVWSAACSTGQEPFTLAMLLHDSLAGAGWQIEITATDLSHRVLARAKTAEWPIESAAEIPPPYLRRYMLRGLRSRSGVMKASPLLRSMIEFRPLNLNDAGWNVGGPLDLIFCRNVLIYFDAVAKRRVIGRLLRLLGPGGYLFLGHAESASEWSQELAAVGPTIYRRRAARSERVENGARP
ncbi:MAG: CheR family methyltransferase [Thermoanaerobaculia bacterium]